MNAVFNELQGVKDVRVAIDRNTGWPRGFAHADFESVEAATVAKEIISQRQLGGRTLRADFSEKKPQNFERGGDRGNSDRGNFDRGNDRGNNRGGQRFSRGGGGRDFGRDRDSGRDSSF